MCVWKYPPRPVTLTLTLNGNSIQLFFPIRLLGTITRGVLRLYTQLEAIVDSVSTVTA